MESASNDGKQTIDNNDNDDVVDCACELVSSNCFFLFSMIFMIQEKSDQKFLFKKITYRACCMSFIRN